MDYEVNIILSLNAVRINKGSNVRSGVDECGHLSIEGGSACAAVERPMPLLNADTEQRG